MEQVKRYAIKIIRTDKLAGWEIFWYNKVKSRMKPVSINDIAASESTIESQGVALFEDKKLAIKFLDRARKQCAALAVRTDKTRSTEYFVRMTEWKK